MKIVVTGALGHIGSRLIRELPWSLAGLEVVLLDSLVTQRYGSLFELPEGAAFRLVEGDVCTADLERYFDGAEVVVHLAAITDATTSLERRDEVIRVNYEGAIRVARACAACGCRLLFPSTTSVYGPQGDIVDEEATDEDLRPQSPYAESKLLAERTLRALGESEGLRCIICRFGTIFGTSRGMRFHTAVNRFCWQAVTGRPLSVWRTALRQQRPYLDVMDAVAAVKLILEKDLFDGRIYNVLTANATVAELIAIISRRIETLAVEYVDTEIMNQLSYTVSDARFRAAGFEPQGSLERGIDETLRLLEGLYRNAPTNGR